MLKNKIYTLEALDTSAPEELKAEVRIIRDHPVFDGHFPGNPVLPGVCTVQIIKELLEEALQRPMRMIRAGSIKYLGFINPDMHPVLQFRLAVKQGNADHVIVNAGVYFEGTVLCSFKGEFINSPAQDPHFTLGQ